MSYPNLQCIKTKDRTVYCSSYICKNHTEGASWVAAVMLHYGIQAKDLKDTFEKEDAPAAAIVYP